MNPLGPQPALFDSDRCNGLPPLLAIRPAKKWKYSRVHAPNPSRRVADNNLVILTRMESCNLIPERPLGMWIASAGHPDAMATRTSQRGTRLESQRNVLWLPNGPTLWKAIDTDVIKTIRENGRSRLFGTDIALGANSKHHKRYHKQLGLRHVFSATR